MAAGNGSSRTRTPRPANADVKALTSRNYDQRALASLGSERTITRQFIQRAIGDFDPENVPLFRLYQMRADPHIAMAMEYMSAPLIRADWHIECDDPKIKAGLTEIVEKVYVRWMHAALNMMPFGYQACVKQYELGDLTSTYEDDQGNVKPVWDPNSLVKPAIIGAPIPLPPDEVTVALDKGRFNGINTPLIKTDANQANESPTIPAEFSLWFTHGFEQTFRNWYGKPRILSAYRPWWSFWFTWHNRDRHAEADADPALQVWYPPGTYPEPNPEDPTGPPIRKSNRDAALTAGKQLRSGATIAWPSEVYTDEMGRMTPVKLWDAQFLKGGENLGAFNELLTDLATDKIRGCLVPDQALVAAKDGQSSKNSAASFQDIFQQSLEQTAKYLDEIFTEHQLDAIREANWGRDSAKAKKVTTGFQQRDMDVLIQLVLAAFTLDPNALPVKFEEILPMLDIPSYTKKEQEERQKLADEAKQAAAEAAAQADPGLLPGETAPPNGPPAPTQTPQQLIASQPTREVIHLTSKSQGRAPEWAHREGRRRDRNVAAIQGRLTDVLKEQYDDIFHAAGNALENMDAELNLGVVDKIAAIVGKVRTAINGAAALHKPVVEGELASIYHAAGLSELARMGLSGETWDVGRDEVQDYARNRAGELIVTMSQSVVERQLRPFLEKALADPKNAATFIERAQGIPVNATALAQAWRDKHASYPQWMAERVVRTEAVKGYNLSAADIWENVGVQEVTMFDGLGGKSGKTDPHCLERNGKTVPIDEFREEVVNEHPNGTLGAVPVTVNVTLRPLPAGVIVANAAQSQSIYGVTSDGIILSATEVGAALAA